MARASNHLCPNPSDRAGDADLIVQDSAIDLLWACTAGFKSFGWMLSLVRVYGARATSEATLLKSSSVRSYEFNIDFKPWCAGLSDCPGDGDLDALFFLFSAGAICQDPADLAGDGDLEALLLLLRLWAGDGDLERLLLVICFWVCDKGSNPPCPDPSDCTFEGDLEALLLLT